MKLKDLREKFTAIDEAKQEFWTVTVLKSINKLKKGQKVVVKARGSSEALKKGAKNLGDPQANMPGYLEVAKDKKEGVEEALSDKDKKKRLAMIKKAVEKISKSNADMAKKDALRMMKDSGMFDEQVNEDRKKDLKDLETLSLAYTDQKGKGKDVKVLLKQISSLKKKLGESTTIKTFKQMRVEGKK